MISITALRKTYGAVTAVDGLTFDINKNEIFGLLGPNGAGKTTAINMICGLLPPSGGAIQLTGYKGKDPKSLIGYCPQENIFYPKLSCCEQLVYIGQLYGIATGAAKQRALELLTLMGLHDKRNEKAQRLSGGMKRRLNICLALMHDPEILILDEPEAGLDPQSRILVRDFIQAFGRNKTVILTTHNMDEADRLADRIAIIDYGKLLLIDTPQKLKKSIGEGTILEIVPDRANATTLDQFAGNLAVISENITKGANSVLVKHPEILEHLPAIKKIAEASGVKITEIKLRENTLEDVFIHLTGRNLRP